LSRSTTAKPPALPEVADAIDSNSGAKCFTLSWGRGQGEGGLLIQMASARGEFRNLEWIEKFSVFFAILVSFAVKFNSRIPGERTGSSLWLFFESDE
jgi:hypothetical protein